MEPRTEQLVSTFVASNRHLKRVPGVVKDKEFECAVCGTVGKYAVRYYDAIQDVDLRMGRDCDRYVRNMMYALDAKELQKILTSQVNILLSA